MKTRQVTVREGELLGPVDWDYDFVSHDWDHEGSSSPDCIKERVSMLRQIETGKHEATTDGGCPRVGWGEVITTGMYDGWPFWKPVPSVLINGTLGAEWHWFGSITGVRAI